MAVVHSTRDYIRIHRSRFVNKLQQFLRIPSISTDATHWTDMTRAAEWLAVNLKALNMQRVEIFRSTAIPIVYAESIRDSVIPTVLIYGHYDVQPADPLNLWTSGPFEPQVRGERLFARGASDMKGQIVAVLEALEAMQACGQDAVNVKFLIEGEEEIGSPSLREFLIRHTGMLQAAFCLNLDSEILGPEIPSISYALRGLAYFELLINGPAVHLPSGPFGGIVHNPAQALAELIAGMHDAQGRVTLPNFYNQVRPIGQEERESLARLPLGEEFFLEQTGAPALWGEQGYSHAERVGARPTLEINGLYSGFTGEGCKTVLPAVAIAKLSMRLVPDQNPEEVHRQLLQYLKDHAPSTIRWDLRLLSAACPSLIDYRSAAVQAMARAMREVWGRDPIYRRDGGTVPAVADMQEILGINSVTTGFSLPDDNAHAPNENIHLPTWYRGIETLAIFFLSFKNPSPG